MLNSSESDSLSETVSDLDSERWRLCLVGRMALWCGLVDMESWFFLFLLFRRFLTE